MMSKFHINSFHMKQYLIETIAKGFISLIFNKTVVTVYSYSYDKMIA